MFRFPKHLQWQRERPAELQRGARGTKETVCKHLGMAVAARQLRQTLRVHGHKFPSIVSFHLCSFYRTYTTELSRSTCTMRKMKEDPAA